jgi:subtilisin family serine protease
MMADTQNLQREIAPIEAPVQFDRTQFTPLLVEVDLFLRVSQARESFAVNGAGLTVAVLDTGLRTTHVDFAGRVLAQRNFTTDNGGNEEDASDGNGHGTNVGGIIVANGNHRGIAPGANIIPLKVLRNNGGGTFASVDKALDWVLQNRDRYNITAVCMSLGDSGNYTSDDDLANDSLRLKIQKLRQVKVAVVVAAGNDFFNHSSQQGMGYPAIIRETVSVGAVYDANEGAFEYRSGAKAFSSGPGQITPFSQRLHPSLNGRTRTDIFAPGAPVTSSGINNDRGESVQHGTSQATPVIAGVILLMQQFHLRETNTLPAVNELATWLRAGGVVIHDGDDENDNVTNTGLDFIRVDALTALDAVKRHLRKRLFYELMLLVK